MVALIDPDGTLLRRIKIKVLQGQSNGERKMAHLSQVGNLVAMMVRALVKQENNVHIDETAASKGVLITVRVAPSDVGKLVGKQGRTAIHCEQF